MTGMGFFNPFGSSGNSGGGGGGTGEKVRYSIQKVTDGTSGEVTYKLMQSINNGTATQAGSVIGLRGNQILVSYDNELVLLDTAIDNIETLLEKTYNFTTFTELNINTYNKTLVEITEELIAKNLPQNTIVTGQIYSAALPFSGNGEAEVIVNSPAFWWKCGSLTNAPYSWTAITGSSGYGDNGLVMDWTPVSYTLPTASDQTLGGVKVGSGLSIDNSGVLSADEIEVDTYKAGDGIYFVPPLPEGYTKVEYILNAPSLDSNTKYHINLDYIPPLNKVVRSEIELKYSSDVENYVVYGWAHYPDPSYVYKSLGYNVAGKSPDIPVTITDKHKIIYTYYRDSNDNGTTLLGVNGGLKVGYGTPPVVEDSFGIFGDTNGGDMGPVAYCYSIKIYEDEELVRNYVPCKNSSNQVGLYETVTGTFIYNDFYAGPEIIDDKISINLEKASANKLGGVKIGSGLSIDSDGVLTATIPIASSQVVGGIKVGSGLSIENDGTLSANDYTLPTASAQTLGGVKVGSGLSIDGSGVLSGDYRSGQGITITSDLDLSNQGLWEQGSIGSGGEVDWDNRIRLADYIAIKDIVYDSNKVKLLVKDINNTELSWTISLFTEDYTLITDGSWVSYGSAINVPNNAVYGRFLLRYGDDSVISPSDLGSAIVYNPSSSSRYVNANIATSDSPGIVKPGTNLSIDNNGTLSLVLDSWPKSNSYNPVTSAGLYNVFQVLSSEEGRLRSLIDWIAQQTVKNLLSFDEKTSTVNGVTFTVHDDATIDISGAVVEGQTFSSIRLIGGEQNTNYENQVPIPSGKYKLICTEGSANTYYLELGYRTASDSARQTQILYDGSIDFTVSTNTTRYDLTLYSVSKTEGYTATVAPMLCLYQLDNDVVPYAPTNRELYEMVKTKQSTLTFDSTPTDGSSNPVTSDGIYDALSTKVTAAQVVGTILGTSGATALFKNEDLNGKTSPGIYVGSNTVSSYLLNNPVSSTNTPFRMYVIALESNAMKMQILVPDSNGGIYTRVYDGTNQTWTAWNKQATTGDITTAINGVRNYVDTGVQEAKDDWFKLGTQITAATLHANNLNNYKTPGHYYIASNTTAGNVDNTPVNYAGKLNVELISNSENYIRQTYFANTDSTGLISVRRYKGVDPDTQQDIWSEWVTFSSQAYVDNAVSTKASITDIYGPGIIIPDGEDLNNDTYKIPGVYYRKSTSTTNYIGNTPVTSNYYKVIVEWIYPDYRLKQTFVSLSRDCTYYMRVYDSGGWQAWNRFRSNEQTLLGVFGVNDATIISSSGFDCDTALTPGIYLAQNTTYAQNASGRPDYANAAANIWRMEVKLLNSIRVYQEMIVYRVGTYEGDFDRYQRMRRSDGTWNSWQHIDTTDVSTYYPSQTT